MPRRPRITRREPQVDPRYHNQTVGHFVTKLMSRGKKALAQRMMYRAFDRLERSGQRNPLDAFELAIRNVTPILEVKPRRVGGATYQVPVEIRADRRLALAMRWIIRAARARSGRSMSEKLAAELLDAIHGTGAAMKRREDTHRMAEANKAFAHYRW